MSDNAGEPIQQRIADAKMPEAGAMGVFDPVKLGPAVQRVATGVARNPFAAWQAGQRYRQGLIAAGAAVTARMWGGPATPAVAPDRADRRFRDPSWNANPAYFGLQQSYLLWNQLLRDLIDVAQLDHRDQLKADFARQVLVDTVAPTNFLSGNPAALKRAFETGGQSVARGMRNYLTDVATNKGKPRQVDTTPFEVGRNLAATPGKVVFRNRLMELIQYEAQTEQTFEIPLLFSPPWINKYYVMDLAPQRSFVEWAVGHGHTVFAISYRNPDASMRDVRLDDYLIEGPRAAIDAIREITGAEKVNIAGLCLGGTLTAILLAYLDAVGEDLVNSVTLLNTLVDFSEPGALGTFTDLATIEGLERKMDKTGYLEASDMAGTFDLLRANDLIWNYVVNNWLMGEDPPAFDILAWNADSTRMPAAMHSFYLRHCYQRNELARNEMEICGERLNIKGIDQDLFMVGAENDHIAPWKSSYMTTQVVASNVHFVLSNAGHIAGIVNPPNPKSKYWTNPDNAEDPNVWRSKATEHAGSWWEHWVGWAGEHAGEKGAAPAMGSRQHPPLSDAPGAYVRDADAA